MAYYRLTQPQIIKEKIQDNISTKVRTQLNQLRKFTRAVVNLITFHILKYIVPTRYYENYKDGKWILCILILNFREHHRA